jgi:uncharacterized protein (UPF0276 family)
MSFTAPNLGHGVGLRTDHFPRILDGPPLVDWFEIISENFMIPGGRPLAVLEHVRSQVPVVMHGVSMSLGSVDPLSPQYLKDLKTLIDRLEPAWVSDHLCFTTIGGHYSHDLLPLPYTEESLRHFVRRVIEVQDYLKRQILIENPSSYVLFSESDIPEWEFISEIASQADCGLLLDVNNVYVSAHNHGFSAQEYLANIPADRVGQIHLAGHTDHGDVIIDTHIGPVIDEVWQLYRQTIARIGPVSTLIEWDEEIPEFEVVVAESQRAREAEAQALEKRAGAA